MPDGLPGVLSFSLPIAFSALAFLMGGAENWWTAGAARDEWRAARRKLSYREQRRVTRATRRGELLGATELVPAQRAYLAYVRHIRGRTLAAVGRAIRIVFPVLYMLMAVGWVIDGLGHPRDVIITFILIGLCAVFAVGSAIWPPRFLRYRLARLDQLHTQASILSGAVPEPFSSPG